MAPAHYRAVLVKRIYLVEWTAQVDLATAKAVVGTLPSIRARAGVPLLLVIMPQDNLTPPTSDARDYILKATKEMLESCETIHNIQAGQSIGSMMYRSVIRGMITFGGLRGKVYIHESLEKFCEWLGTADRISATALRDELEAPARS